MAVIEKLARSRVAKQYSDLKRRCRAKFSKRGALTRPPMAIEFSLAELRVWAGKHFTVENNWAAQCAYCHRPLGVEEWVLDHYVPLERGGQNVLDNLRVCCAPCNALKGPLLPETFNALILFLHGVAMVDRVDIMQRLRMAGHTYGLWRGKKGVENG